MAVMTSVLPDASPRPATTADISGVECCPNRTDIVDLSLRRAILPPPRLSLTSS